MLVINTNYKDLVILGMYYVRVVKDINGNVGGYILIDNNNKPVKDVYDYYKYRKLKHGDSLNSLKRKVHDLCHLYDYMNLAMLTPELINYRNFYEFVEEYLSIIDPNFRINDCIERSLLKRVPIFEPYSSENVSILNKNNSGGIQPESVVRIANNAKLFLEYLCEVKHRDIDLPNIFNIIAVNYRNPNDMLIHMRHESKMVYSVKGILKAANIPIKKRNENKPIDISCIFEEDEEEAFFYELYKLSSPSYQFLFYLLSVTGMRISEALALKIYDMKTGKYVVDFNDISSDIKLIDDKNDIWEITVRIDPTNPSDLQIKGNRERKIQIVDGTKQFRNLYKQMLLYRNIIMRKKKKQHKFLFINRNGDRLKYPRTIQRFHEILSYAGLDKRAGRGELVIHSFRHTFASKWIRDLKVKKVDVELDLLSRTLGHSSAKVTQEIYIHFFKDDCIFRTHPDTDSGNIRTAFRNYPDSVTAHPDTLSK